MASPKDVDQAENLIFQQISVGDFEVVSYHNDC